MRQALSAEVDNADDEWEGVKQTTSIYSRLQNLRFMSNKVKSIISPVQAQEIIRKNIVLWACDCVCAFVARENQA